MRMRMRMRMRIMIIIMFYSADIEVYISFEVLNNVSVAFLVRFFTLILLNILNRT